MVARIKILLLLCLFSLSTLFVAPPVSAQTCTSYGELIDGSGWEDHGDIADGGKLIYAPDDSELPVGYAAVGDGWDVALTNPDRYMPSGWWSIYRVCTDDVPAPDESCPDIDRLLDSHGWEGIESVDDGGVVVRLWVPDTLPWGYEATHEDWYISLDNEDRYMPAGYWTIYHLGCE